MEPLKGPLCTLPTLKSDLITLGLSKGDTILLHTSLRRIGYINGGPETLIHALLDTLDIHTPREYPSKTPIRSLPHPHDIPLAPAASTNTSTGTGTLIVPTQSAPNSDPSTWRNPPAPREWWPAMRATMPAFDARTTPTWGMGVLAEMLRVWPGAVRSGHPQTSFAGVGREAGRVVLGYGLELDSDGQGHVSDGQDAVGHEEWCRLGEKSPLGRLAEMGRRDGHGEREREARVLLVGVGWEKCTAFHLAEYRVWQRRREGGQKSREEGLETLSFAAYVHGKREWVTVKDVEIDDGDFTELGEAFERQSESLVTGKVGAAECKLFSLREAVDFAVKWIEHNRKR